MKELKKIKKQAKALDRKDSLKKFRSYFLRPKNTLYFCSNSLGLPAKQSKPFLSHFIDQWKTYGAQGWFHKKTNWYTSYEDSLETPLANLLGAQREEVCVMNSLTVNLHLLLVSFFRPTPNRYKIIVETPIFPSDLYALKSHLNYHGFDPNTSLIIVDPREGDDCLNEEDIIKIFEKEGSSIALAFFSSVNYLTGQVLNMDKLTKAAKEKGIIIGYDLAHAAGNVCLDLHHQRVDFAVGCSYKYLCSGPGGPGFIFVHKDHHKKDFYRFGGWWGNDPKKRFKMDEEKDFIPFGGASSWEVSTPSLLARLPFLCSLKIFDKATMPVIRKKSELQTQFLLRLLNDCKKQAFDIITPKDKAQRGSQISLRIKHHASTLLKELHKENIICDFRPPNIIRITPSPLYTSFLDIVKFVQVFSKCLEKI